MIAISLSLVMEVDDFLTLFLLALTSAIIFRSSDDYLRGLVEVELSD